MSDDWNNATPATAPARRQSPIANRQSAMVDRLPPHSEEAEKGVLGCILLAPMENIPKARKRLLDPEGQEFYVQANREIWLTLGRMYDDRLAGKPLSSTATAGDGIDVITVRQRLKDYQRIEEAGGLQYLAGLPDAVPAAANLEHYLHIVHEKFTLRQAIAKATDFVTRAYEWPGQVEHLVHTLQDEIAIVARLATPPQSAERMYIKPSEMGDGLMARWFGRKKGVHGLPLPDLAFGAFPFLIRTRELTLIEAETKMGKSTMTSYIALHLLQSGMRAIIDSREVHFEETMNKLVMQLTGVSEARLCETGRQQGLEGGYPACECGVCKPAVRQKLDAMRWLEGKVEVNRTTGIKHWRDILDAFYELAEQGWNFFSLDSLMRIGIPDDDFTQQAECVSSFANFTIETDSAMWMVNHRNKGDGDYRQKSGGSYKVAANASNICSVQKNQKKYEALAESFDLLRGKTISWEEFLTLEVVKKWLPQWDAKFYVHDQRLDGTRSNAARELWFLKRGGQYFDHRHDRPTETVNWLARWTGQGDTPAPREEDVAENFPEAQDSHGPGYEEIAGQQAAGPTGEEEP